MVAAPAARALIRPAVGRVVGQSIPTGSEERVTPGRSTADRAQALVGIGQVTQRRTPTAAAYRGRPIDPMSLRVPGLTTVFRSAGMIAPRTSPRRPGPGPSRPPNATPDRYGARSSGTGPSSTRLSGTGPSGTRLSGTGPGTTEPGATGPNRAGHRATGATGTQQGPATADRPSPTFSKAFSTVPHELVLRQMISRQPTTVEPATVALIRRAPTAPPAGIPQRGRTAPPAVPAVARDRPRPHRQRGPRRRHRVH